MADAAGKSDRFQPTLFDRLIDDEPQKKSETGEARALSLAEIRAAAMRDIGWLLNAVHLEAVEDLADYPLARKSVINFGIPGYVGSSVGEVGYARAISDVKEALLAFEPRLAPDTIVIEIAQDASAFREKNTVAFTVDGSLWSQPAPQFLLMRTELDLERGVAKVMEQRESDRAPRRR